MSESPFRLGIRDLRLEPVAGQPPVEISSLDLRGGQVTLLCGPSGSGKSSVGLLFAGLRDALARRYRISGQAQLADRSLEARSLDLAREAVSVGALVFQDGALFDDLSVADNLAIARDHTRRPGAPGAAMSAARGLLSKSSVHELSGGERQRVAIGRAFASARPLLILDEPNAGLDPAASRALAHTIRTLCDETGVAVMIIAHHVDELAPIADQALILSPNDGRARFVSTEAQSLRDAVADAARRPELGTDDFTRLLSRSPWRWTARYFLNSLDLLLLSPGALGFVLFCGGVVGFVTTWFLMTQFASADLVRAVYGGQLIVGVGSGLFNALLPITLSVLLAARNGALIAADLARRTQGQQLLAMQNLGIPATRYLFAAFLTANLVAFLAAVWLSLGVAAAVAYATWLFFEPRGSLLLFSSEFFSEIPGVGAAVSPGAGWLSLKMALSSVATTGAAILFGAPKSGALPDANQAIAATIITATCAVLVAHTLVAIAQFDG